jgi:hypothetical protein
VLSWGWLVPGLGYHEPSVIFGERLALLAQLEIEYVEVQTYIIQTKTGEPTGPLRPVISMMVKLTMLALNCQVGRRLDMMTELVRVHLRV